MTVYIAHQQWEKIKNSTIAFLEGVAFLRTGEDIAAYIDYPDVVPSGAPLLACFINLERDEIDVLQYTKDMLAQRHSLTINEYVIICLKKDLFQSEAILVENESERRGGVTIFNNTGKMDIQLSGIQSTTQIWAHKKVVIVGTGSIGSGVAMELAKAGIEEMYLFDNSKLEEALLHRSTGNLNDIGRYKTNALCDSIINKNKNISKIISKEIDVNTEVDELRNWCQKVDIIICTTNASASFLTVNQIAVEMKKTAIFVKTNMEASFGYIFRFNPQVTNRPCWSCIGNGIFEFKNDGMHYVRVPGMPSGGASAPPVSQTECVLNVDLLPYIYMTVKCTLEILSDGKLKAIPNLSTNIAALIYPTGDSNYIKNSHTVDYPRLWWYPVRVDRNMNCPVCSVQSP